MKKLLIMSLGIGIIGLSPINLINNKNTANKKFEIKLSDYIPIDYLNTDATAVGSTNTTVTANYKGMGEKNPKPIWIHNPFDKSETEFWHSEMGPSEKFKLNGKFYANCPWGPLFDSTSGIATFSNSSGETYTYDFKISYTYNYFFGTHTATDRVEIKFVFIDEYVDIYLSGSASSSINWAGKAGDTVINNLDSIYDA